MKNKGFVFVETIIVILFLTASLLMIYGIFVGVLNNEKRHAMFNDTTYLYRTYYIEDFLVSLNMDQYIDKYLRNTGDLSTDRLIIEFNCNDISLYDVTDEFNNIDLNEYAKRVFCENIISKPETLNVKHIYITNYNVNNLKKCLNKANKNNSTICSPTTLEALKNISVNMGYYLKSLNGTSSDIYRLIIEYEETKIDTTNVLEGNKCPADYEYSTSNNSCEKKIKRNYYSNVKLVTRKG